VKAPANIAKVLN